MRSAELPTHTSQAGIALPSRAGPASGPGPGSAAPCCSLLLPPTQRLSLLPLCQTLLFLHGHSNTDFPWLVLWCSDCSCHSSSIADGLPGSVAVLTSDRHLPATSSYPTVGLPSWDLCHFKIFPHWRAFLCFTLSGQTPRQNKAFMPQKHMPVLLHYIGHYLGNGRTIVFKKTLISELSNTSYTSF